jgi:hypothetical protein
MLSVKLYFQFKSEGDLLQLSYPSVRLGLALGKALTNFSTGILDGCKPGADGGWRSIFRVMGVHCGAEQRGKAAGP